MHEYKKFGDGGKRKSSRTDHFVVPPRDDDKLFSNLFHDVIAKEEGRRLWQSGFIKCRGITYTRYLLESIFRFMQIYAEASPLGASFFSVLPSLASRKAFSSISIDLS